MRLGISCIALCLILANTTSCLASGHFLGVFGQTYPIREPDAYQELIERARKVDWRKVRQEFVSRIKDYRPQVSPLPVADKHRTRYVTITYTLNFNIPDGRGGILYPKGYSFNVLDYVRLHRRYIFFDADDSEQLAWYLASEYYRDRNTVVVLTGGHYTLAEKLKRPVYYATESLLKRLQIRKVPSVVSQEGNKLRIDEIPPVLDDSEKTGNPEARKEVTE